MSKKVLVDTSFLITLVDRNQENHEKAKTFYSYFLQEQYTLYLSAIVAAEFSLQQALEELPLERFQLLTFTVPDAIKSAALAVAYGKKSKQEGLQDDFKLLAQAVNRQVDYLVTDDMDLADKIIVSKGKEMGLRFSVLKVREGKERYFGGTQKELF
jgi:predicted nucleic acid-binding protein